MALAYTPSAAVAAAASMVLKILALALPGQSTQFSLAGALAGGAGDTMYPLYASALGIWLFRVVVAYIFVGSSTGVVGAWAALFWTKCAAPPCFHDTFQVREMETGPVSCGV